MGSSRLAPTRRDGVGTIAAYAKVAARGVAVTPDPEEQTEPFDDAA